MNSLNLIFDLNITSAADTDSYCPHVITDLFNGLSFKYSNNSLELKETSDTVKGRN